MVSDGLHPPLSMEEMRSRNSMAEMELRLSRFGFLPCLTVGVEQLSAIGTGWDIVPSMTRACNDRRRRRPGAAHSRQLDPFGGGCGWPSPTILAPDLDW